MKEEVVTEVIATITEEVVVVEQIATITEEVVVAEVIATIIGEVVVVEVIATITEEVVVVEVIATITEEVVVAEVIATIIGEVVVVEQIVLESEPTVQLPWRLLTVKSLTFIRQLRGRVINLVCICSLKLMKKPLTFISVPSLTLRNKILTLNQEML
jgi:hypothetical protein